MDEDDKVIGRKGEYLFFYREDEFVVGYNRVCGEGGTVRLIPASEMLSEVMSEGFVIAEDADLDKLVRDANDEANSPY